jgi:UDPglucose 6-dehydrogenase
MNMGPVGVVGLGVVGRTTRDAFDESGIATVGYDPYLGVGGSVELAACDVVFVCVPTPSTRQGGYDLAEVWAATENIAANSRPATIVAIKSTVPPGTSDRLAMAFPSLRFASVPEFLVATDPVASFRSPDRIVIGADDPSVGAVLQDLMTRVIPNTPVARVRAIEAELVKLSANAMLSARVAMANELAEVCARYGVEWAAVQEVVGMDRRIGPSHLTVSPERGFGGACLPKDLDGLIVAAREGGYEPTVLERLAAFNRWIRRIGATGERAASYVDVEEAIAQ